MSSLLPLHRGAVCASRSFDPHVLTASAIAQINFEDAFTDGDRQRSSYGGWESRSAVPGTQ
jgi:hypothetical protein